MTNNSTSAASQRRAHLHEQKEKTLLRKLTPATSRSPGKIVKDGRTIIDFSSNDYLGLSGNRHLVRAAEEAMQEYGTGSGASRLMSGDLDIHHQLEDSIAAFKGKEAALLVNSGYQANTGLLPALTDRHDAIIADKYSHASLLDGALLSRATLLRYPHNDMEELEQILDSRRSSFQNVLIVTESVFSMDGDFAPLQRCVDLKRCYNCEMLVDEAHATGVFGPHGKGRVEKAGLTENVEFVMGTFSKALGGFGAYVAASETDVRYLVNSMRSFIYSTALPAPVVASNLAAIELCNSDETPRKELLAKANWLRKELRSSGFEVRGESQIIPVLTGSNEETLRAGELLLERGLQVVPIRPPTVPPNQARLRLSVCAAHTQSDLEQLVEALSDVL